MSSSLESFNSKYENGNQNAIVAFTKIICAMLVSLMF